MQAFLQLTVTSVISIILFSLCFTILLEIVLRDFRLLSRIKYELLLICMVVPVIRIIIPIEVLPWTKNIAVTHILPDIVQFVNKDLTIFAGNEVTLWKLILGVFVVGALVKAIIIIISYVDFRRSVNILPDIDDSEILELVNKIMKEKGKNTKVILKWLASDGNPCIGGFVKSYILIPKAEYSKTELECVLRHEIAHCVHGDMIIRLGWIIIKIICWWNPVVYNLDKQFEQLLEIRADENAVKCNNNDISCDYMETLVRLNCETKKEKGSGYCAFFQEENGILPKKRVQLLLKRVDVSRSSFLISNLLSVACILTLTVAMNVFILEPMGEVPEVEYIEGPVLTNTNSFLIKNEDGTYDLYFGGKFRATLSSSLGSDLPIYESIEEAAKYEEFE